MITVHPEAEKALIGAVFLNPDSFMDLRPQLPAYLFSNQVHSAIWSAFGELEDQNIPIDELQVAKVLFKNGIEVGVAGLCEIASYGGSGQNGWYWAKLVADAAVARNMCAAMTAAAGQIQDGVPPSEVLSQLWSQVESLELRGQLREVPAEDAAKEDARLLAEKLAGENRGVQTGFRRLDKITGGMQPGSLNILAARPSVGKTAMAINIATHAAVHKSIPTLFVSLEMSRNKIFSRALAAEQTIYLDRLRTGDLEPEDYEKVESGRERLAKSPWWIYAGETDVGILKSMVRRCVRKHKIGLVVLDYLQLMKPTKSGNKSETREREVAQMSAGLKAIANEHGIPILALCQLSRALEARNDKRPMLSDLRDSGSIEQDADLVMSLYRENYHNKSSKDNIAIVEVLKNREGETGEVELFWEPRYTRFSDA